MKTIIRSLMWRLGRYIYKYARKENFYSAKKNGEFKLVADLMRVLEKNKEPIFLDIGSFKGEWAINVFNQLKHEKIEGKIFAFEPAFNTIIYLKKKIKNKKNIILENKAFSDKTGVKEFYIFGELNGTNSLIKNKSTSINKVSTITVDEFIKTKNLKKIFFIKSDTEGHDFSVIKGAKSALEKELIDFWQFEYNHRWIDNRSYLKDVFNFLENSNYIVGKVTVNQIEVFTNWSQELEKFFEANYLIINKKELHKINHKRVVFNKYSVLENE